ncbi:TetR/AcrR family transcriptional regulator [Arthrobacter sp. NQ7]|uniref:TetR/AcrR family transcriptional regulator n=1 Tax=Arthrobacter sp. NQ7 TaxID=3032303 RepID=UPI00240FEACB|nr:TetR/AcrR family transcriptional regulator [Arthrobacter sp. NQ7]MDJ0458628.1 TetR/AcrR family transcriptional regulator [Arthrobacter sp. NQ7]
MATTSTKRRGPYAKTAALQVKILETCLELFGETGFHNLTMADVAQRAGISHTGLLHHFPSKEVLLSRVLQLKDERTRQFFRDRGVDVLTLPEDSREIRALLQAVVANDLQPGLIELNSTLAAEASSTDHPAHEYYQIRYSTVIGLYSQAFAALAKRGELKTDTEPGDLAAMFVALTDGLQIQWLYDRDTAKLEKRASQFLSSVISDF